MAHDEESFYTLTLHSPAQPVTQWKKYISENLLSINSLMASGKYEKFRWHQFFKFLYLIRSFVDTSKWKEYTPTYQQLIDKKQWLV